MSLRLLIGALVAGALLLVPLTTSLLLSVAPPPDFTVRLEPCTGEEAPDHPCVPVGVPGEHGPRVLKFAGVPPGSGPGEKPARPLLPPGAHQGQLFRFGGPQLSPIRRHFMLINLISSVLVVGLAIALASLLLRRPFRAVQQAIGDIEQGAAPPAWAFSGPTELRRIGIALGRLGQQLRANLQERDLMLAGLSHDLRSPLARIQAALELRAIDGERWDDTLHDVREIDHIVGQFIDFARDGRDEPLSRVSLDDLVRSVLRPDADAGLSLQLAAATPLPVRSSALRRALRNLVDNARTHGAEPVVVRTYIADGYACLQVEDAGAGIAVADWERLLQPFARGSVERSAGGAGLGLAIVHRVAGMHGGELRMTPRDGEQRFAIELRLPLRHTD
jgi:signal transduction histidine kinase